MSFTLAIHIALGTPAVSFCSHYRSVSTGNFFPAFLLLAAVLLPREQRTAAVICLVLSIGLTACVFTGGERDCGDIYTRLTV